VLLLCILHLIRVASRIYVSAISHVRFVVLQPHPDTHLSRPPPSYDVAFVQANPLKVQSDPTITGNAFPRSSCSGQPLRTVGSATRLALFLPKSCKILLLTTAAKNKLSGSKPGDVEGQDDYASQVQWQEEHKHWGLGKPFAIPMLHRQAEEDVVHGHIVIPFTQTKIVKALNDTVAQTQSIEPAHDDPEGLPNEISKVPMDTPPAVKKGIKVVKKKKKVATKKDTSTSTPPL
jgi:hypothetical protein